jgi:rod shape-determining protein MreD
MLRNFIVHILILVLFVILQAVLFGNMHLSSLQLIPTVFILAILLLPFEFPNWLILIIAFFSGLALDIFNDTLGVNTASVTLMAYVRPFILSTLAPYDGYENGTLPRLSYYGFPWVIKYNLMSVFVFSFAYYFLISFSFTYFLQDLLKIFLGSLYTLIIVLLMQFAFFKK